MEEHHNGTVKLPPNLNLQGLNIASEWAFWKQSFEDYLVSTGHDQSADKVKISLLRNMMGHESVRILLSLPIAETDKLAYDKVVTAIDNYANPRNNVVFERFLFNSRKQVENEPFDAFLMGLRQLIKSCQFTDLSGEPLEKQLLRDKIVHGISDRNVQEALLRQDDLTLEKAIKFCQSSEQSKHQVQVLNSDMKEVLVLRKSNNKYHQPCGKELPKDQTKFLCGRCKTWHGSRQCPAFGKVCSRCGLKNHFAVSCRVKNVKSVEQGQTSHDIGLHDDDCHNCYTVGLGAIEKHLDNVQSNIRGEQKPEWSENILIEDVLVNCKLDSGAEVNVMPFKIFQSINKSVGVKPFNTHIRLEGFDGSTCKPIGRASLKCQYKGKTSYENFMIVDTKNMLLGLPGCLALNLIKRVNFSSTSQENVTNPDKVKFVDMYKDVFTGFGRFPEPCSIPLRISNPHIVYPARRVPNALLKPLQTELERLESRNAIAKVEQISPDACINNIVIVEKNNGKIRLCLDPRDLNEYIVRKPKIMPTLEDVASKLIGKNYFSVFDLSEGFHHINLTDESSWKCCFASPFGVYRYTVLPFGVSNAPEEFQNAVEKYFGNIENVTIWIDDILVAGTSKADHDSAVAKVMQRAREIGAVFNKDKLQYCQNEVRYVGQIFGNGIMKVDPERCEALLELKPPTDREGLQRIIGSFNYVRRYVPQMAELMFPLCQLLRKDCVWIWTELHQAAFEKLKAFVGQSPALSAFDPTKKIVLQCDASKNGLGSCLFHDCNGELKLVACASRQMNSSELNYSQSEKELLSIVFGCKKFHQYIYGMKQVEVYTDHKPLTTIMQKHISKIGSVRLQRLRLKLLRYNLNLCYVPGKHLHFPDMLSRNSLQKTEEDPEMLEMVHTVSKHIPLTEDQKKKLRLTTVSDDTLSQVMEFCRNGWPCDAKITHLLKPYHTVKDNLFIESGILFWGEKIVVPKDMRSLIAHGLHKGHPGFSKLLQRARELYYWPNMSKDLKQVIITCRTCEKFSKRNSVEPLLPHRIPELRFEKIGSDILQLGNSYYLVLIDYFSHWLELRPIRDKTSACIIDQMQEVFSRFGYPLIVVADNNPFISLECRRYFNSKGIELVTSTPHYPKSNGMAENAVGICKMLLRKSIEDNCDYREYIMAYNNTPIPNLHCSPSQILNSRRIRTELPVSKELLEPQIQENVKDLLRVKQSITKNTHDRQRLKKVPDFEIGEDVVIRTRNDKYWQKGTIERKGSEPRSYWVRRYGDKRIFRRNTSQLKRSHTKENVNDRSMPTELLLTNLSNVTQPELLQEPTPQLTQKSPPQLTNGSEYSLNKDQGPIVEHDRGGQRISRFGRHIKPSKRFDL